MGEIKEPVLTFVTMTTFDVGTTTEIFMSHNNDLKLKEKKIIRNRLNLRARAIVQIALKIAMFNTQWITITQLATDDLIKTKCVRFAFVALFTRNMIGTNARSRFLFTQCRRWTITFATIWKTVVTCTTCLASTSNNIRFALTLATEWIAFKRGGTFIVTITLQCSAIIIGCQ